MEEIKDPDGLLYTVLQSYINQTAKVEPCIETIFYVIIFLLMISTAQLRKIQHQQKRIINPETNKHRRK